jgi:hypothetical protein
MTHGLLWLALQRLESIVRRAVLARLAAAPVRDAFAAVPDRQYHLGLLVAHPVKDEHDAPV